MAKVGTFREIGIDPARVKLLGNFSLNSSSVSRRRESRFYVRHGYPGLIKSSSTKVEERQREGRVAKGEKEKGGEKGKKENRSSDSRMSRLVRSFSPRES